MPHVLGNKNDPRAPNGVSHFVIAYAVICILAAAFIIASALVSG